MVKGLGWRFEGLGSSGQDLGSMSNGGKEPPPCVLDSEVLGFGGVGFRVPQFLRLRAQGFSLGLSVWCRV